MGHRYDGSSIDLEKELVRYMIERRVTRRDLLERIGKVGAVAALAPVVAACTGGASASPSAAPSAAPSSAPSSGPSAEPSPAPSAAPVVPEDKLFLYNWTDYMDQDVAIKGFEEKYKVKITQDYFDTVDTQLTKLGSDGGGYDVSIVVSTDVPKTVAKGALAKIDRNIVTNIGNLGTEWADPLYDPGNVYSVPYMWWTTGIGYDTTKVQGTPTSSKLLWDANYSKHIAMLDDWQEVFGMTLIQMGKDPNTTNTADLDAALALLQQQKPIVRTYTTDTVKTMSGKNIWVGQIWSGDLYQIQPKNKNIAYFIPEEGGVRGNDTIVVTSGAKHPIAAQLFVNHLLDAQVSAANTNTIGYMGPNAAAKAYIDPTILADPSVNPEQALISSLEELIDLEPAVRDEYLKRWQILRGGG